MLVCLFLLMSAVLAALLCFGFSLLSPWWLVPLFLGAFLLLNVLYLLYLLLTSYLFGFDHPYEKDNRYCRFMTHLTLDWLLHLFRIRAHVTGMEILPEEPFVLVGNHRSDFDPIITFRLLKHRKTAFISKKENMRIPIAGRYIYQIGFLPLDRDNPLRAMRTIKEGARLVREENMIMGIYPEGTRSKTEKMLPFKEGAFLLAKKAEAPIVVMALRGTGDISRNVPLRSTRVSGAFLRVIPKETVASTSIEELSAMAREPLTAYLQAP